MQWMGVQIIYATSYHLNKLGVELYKDKLKNR